MHLSSLRMAIESRKEKLECFRCGGNHFRRDCTIRGGDLKCEGCGKSGHVKKMCRTVKEKANIAVENDYDVEDEDWLDEVETYG
jgi:late competence protein required for DNA uptake (superfamily II DNA/RNA helicase)